MDLNVFSSSDFSDFKASLASVTTFDSLSVSLSAPGMILFSTRNFLMPLYLSSRNSTTTGGK